VEHAAHLLAGDAAGRVPQLAPLTRANYTAGWDKRRAAQSKPERDAARTRACAGWGAPISIGSAKLCTECRATKDSDHLNDNRTKAVDALARMRALKTRPCARPAGRQRGAKNDAHQRAANRWSGPTPDPTVFATEILPRPRDLAARQIAAATGLSQHYCALIRRGRKAPHPRHWSALQAVASQA
jgi:hypothetical protein